MIDLKEIIRKHEIARAPVGKGRSAAPFLVLTLSALVLVFGVALSSFARQEDPSGGTVSLSPHERQWLDRHDGQIRIGITVIPPQILLGDDGYKGLSIDYIRLLERKLGCRFELAPYPTWNEVIQAARERRIDMIFAAQETPERLHYLLFTEPYIELPNIIMVRKDKKGGADLKEMQGWNVAASEGSAVHEYLRREFPDLDLRPVADELSGLRKVSLGEVDAMVVEISRASYHIEKAGILNLRVAGDAGLLYRLRFAVRNDWPELRGILDKGLAAFTAGERREINRRWIVVGDKSFIASREFLISLLAGLGVVVLTIIGAIVWSRTLRRTVKQRTAQLQRELAERKQTEEALRNTYEYTQNLISSANVMIIGLDASGDICMFNTFAEKITGYTMEELAGIDWFEKIVPKDRYAQVWETFRNYREKSGTIPPTFENSILTKSGEERIISWQNSSITAPGQPISTISFGMDITERKRIEEALSTSEAELRALINAMTDVIFVCNSEGRYLKIIDTSSSLSYKSPKEFLGKTLHDIFPKDQADFFLNYIRQALNTQESVNFEYSLSIENNEIWFNATISPMSDDKCLMVARDITERNLAEQERQANLKLLESLDQVNRAIQGTDHFEQMMSDVLDVMLAVLDCDRAFLMYPCDPEAETWQVLMERNKPEYPGVLKLGIEMQMDPDVAETLRILLAADGPVKFGPGTPYALPADVSQRFGFKCFMSMAIHPTGDKPWQFGIHQCSFAREWTPEEERLLKEIGRRLADGLTSMLMYRDLQESERRFSTLVNQAADAFFVHDMEGRILEVNRTACESLGYSMEELLEMSVAEVDAEFITHDHVKNFWGKLTPEQAVTVEGRHKRKDGTTFPVEVRLGLLQLEDRQVVLALARDITERKSAEEALRQLNEELEARVNERTSELENKSLQLYDSRQALMNLVADLNENTAQLALANANLQELDRLKSMFIASMSHELRTPLNSIIGFSSIILDEWLGTLNEEQKGKLAIVLRTGKHLLTLINDVIDVSKIEAGKMETTTEEFDIQDLVGEVLELVKKEIEDKGLSLVVETSSINLHTDRRRLFQCLVNLLSNAVKFTEQGLVTVKTTILYEVAAPAGRDLLQITVSDTGIGIASADQPRLFTPFTRIASPLKERVKGTGLGLYLVKKITEEILQGQVGLESIYGKGSSFFLKIPLSTNREGGKDENRPGG
ncbi:MAG: PAS domain S-box protein [Proteobacteria bacterium]|nr:PAS domain S-box protein [Pseudomonadota bacterium]MBU4294900.1 PAS domain S-box protein [Pseudomonadota bacterium]MCG2747345.1 PAS domain S-box protein [Desulfobulbaceae bacterium]